MLKFLKQYDQSNSEKELKKLYDGKESLASRLPYEEYLAEDQIFVLKDQSLGIIYDVRLVEHEAASLDRLEEISDHLSSWLSLPSDYRVQYIFDQQLLSASEIRSLCKKKGFGGFNSLADYLHEEKVKTLVANSKKKYPLFERKGYLCIMKKSKGDDWSLNDLVPKRGEKILHQESVEFIKILKEFRKTTDQLVSLSPLSLTPIDAEAAIQLVRDHLYGKSKESLASPSYTNSYSLSEQIVDRGIKVNFKGRCCEGYHTRTISLKVPGIKYFGMGAWLTTLPFPIKASYQLYRPDKSKVDFYLNWKEFSLKNSLSEISKKEYKEVRAIKKKLAYEEKAIWVTATLIVDGKTTEEVEKRVLEVKKVCTEKFDAFSVLDEDIGFALWWDSLPFCYSPIADATYQRALPMLSTDIAQMLPVHDSARGNTGFQVLQSREGNICPISLFESQSTHTIYLGDTGTGKSRFVGDVICNSKRPKHEYLVFIFEMKTSYPMLVNFFQGEVNQFSVSESSPSSPFLGVYDEEKIKFLTNWIKTAIEITSPSFVIESELKEALYQAIKIAVEKKRKALGLSFVDGDLIETETKADFYINFDLICTELSNLPGTKQFEALTEKIEEMLGKLAIFRGEGIYASCTRPQPSDVASIATTFLFDFEGLKSDPVRRDLEFLARFEQIRQIRMRPENQDKEVIIILDEIDCMDRGIPMFAEIISDIAETGRKDGISLHSSTCNPESFNDPKLQACRTALRVSTNYVFTSMSAENLAELEKSYDIIDEKDKIIIGSLKTIAGEYSEVYVITKDGFRGVFRLVEAPIKRWLQPTNIKDTRVALKALKEFGGDPAQAARHLVEIELKKENEEEQ